MWIDADVEAGWIGYPEATFAAEVVDSREPLQATEPCAPPLPPAPFDGRLTSDAEGPFAAGASLGARWLEKVCQRPAVSVAWQRVTGLERSGIPAGPGCRAEVDRDRRVGFSVVGDVRAVCVGGVELPCDARGPTGCFTPVVADDAVAQVIVEAEAFGRVDRVQVLPQPPINFDPGLNPTPDALTRGRLADLALDEAAGKLVVLFGARAPEGDARCGRAQSRAQSGMAVFDAETLDRVTTATIPGCLGAVEAWRSPELLFVRRRREGEANPGQLELVAARPQRPPMMHALALIGPDDAPVVGLTVAGAWAAVATRDNLHVVSLADGGVRHLAQEFRVGPRLDSTGATPRLAFIEPRSDTPCSLDPAQEGWDVECSSRCEPGRLAALTTPLAIDAITTPYGEWASVVGRDYGVMARCGGPVTWIEPIEAPLHVTGLGTWGEAQLLLVGLGPDPAGFGVSVAQRFAPEEGRFVAGRTVLGGAFPTAMRRGSDGSYYLLLSRSAQVARLRVE